MVSETAVLAPAQAQAKAAAAPSSNATPSKKAAAEPRRVKFSGEQACLAYLKSLAKNLPVGTKYQVDTVIGEGAYGVVCSAIHRYVFPFAAEYQPN